MTQLKIEIVQNKENKTGSYKIWLWIFNLLLLGIYTYKELYGNEVTYMFYLLPIVMTVLQYESISFLKKYFFVIPIIFALFTGVLDLYRLVTLVDSVDTIFQQLPYLAQNMSYMFGLSFVTVIVYKYIIKTRR